MSNQNKHNECIIGIWFDYDDADLVTLSDIKEKLKWTSNVYRLADYLDKRKSTNLLHFNFCPVCGKEIDYKLLRLSITSEDN